MAAEQKENKIKGTHLHKDETQQKNEIKAKEHRCVQVYNLYLVLYILIVNREKSVCARAYVCIV